MLIERLPEFLSIACLIEVSSYKPGNVSRYLDFEDVTFEDFLISSVSIYNPARELSRRSYLIIRKGFPLEKIRIGYFMRKAIERTLFYVRSNTNLGIVMLTFPLIPSIIFSILKNDLEKLSENIITILRNTSYKDTIDLYRAINLSKANLPKANFLDVKDSDSIRIIKERKINLYDVMKYSEEYDLISKEYLTGYKISISSAKELLDNVMDGLRLTNAVENLYIKLLATYEDSHIIKTRGYEIAKRVKEIAKDVLNGNLDIRDLENFLIENRINPGAIADIITSSIFLFFIYYYAEENRWKGMEIRL